MSIEQWMQRSERWMYPEGRPNRAAATLNGLWARVAASGLGRNWLVTLEVRGRSSGRTTSLPLIGVNEGGERYLVAMLGERAQWVQNVRAAGGEAVLRHGRRERVRLVEVPSAERAPILRHHLRVAPAARSFFPVDQKAPLSEFEKIAADYPVFRIEPAPSPAPSPRTAAPAGPAAGTAAPAPRKRRRLRRWLAIGGVVLVALLALTIAGIGVYLKTSAEPPLALPAAVSPPQGTLEGTWTVSTGSVAGFRIEQTVMAMTGDVVGRTKSVTGSATIGADRVASASFRLDMTAITANGKPSPQFDQTLDTRTYPTATFTLTGPVQFDASFASGAEVSKTVAGQLTLRGTSRTVQASISARRNGSSIDVAGSIPIAFADWRIPTPAGYGLLGSLADHGSAEFLLVLAPR